MTRFLLARHAEHTEQGRRLVGRLPGIDLSASGRRQAEALAEALGGAGITAIVSSPRRRARLTASAVAARVAREVELMPELEEIDYGSWTGLQPNELDRDPQWRLWNSLRATHRIPGGESMLEVQSRMVATAERLAAREPDGVVLVVSHQDPLRALLACWLGMPLDFVLRLDLDPASVSTVELVGGQPRCLSLNRVYGKGD